VLSTRAGEVKGERRNLSASSLAAAGKIVNLGGSTLGSPHPPLEDSAASERDPDASGVRRVDRRLRVLVVDDEPMIGSSLKRILSGAHVTAVTSGEEALAAIRGGEAYDVVICDVMMPVLNGVDVYEAVLATHPAAAERFVFITGGVLHERCRRFLESVPNRVVLKPFDIRAMRELVEQVAARAG
jgi:CheY-like chemotaxis protein